MKKTLFILTALLNLSLLEGGLAAVASGQPLGDLPPAIRAKEGVSLQAGANKNIGGGVFNFSFKPIAIKEDGSFAYSDWVNTFRQEIRSGRRAGVNLVSEDPVTGELHYAMTHFTVLPDQINMLELQFLQQAVPMDIHEENGIYIVQARNFVSIDAPVFSADGETVLVKANGDVDFAANAINARNLFFSTTRSISGSVESQGGIVSLHANGGIGSADKAFNISGTSTYTLGSVGDVFLQTDGAIKLSALNGNYVTIDARNGSLTPTSQDDLNIVGRRIDYYGDLDPGSVSAPLERARRRAACTGTAAAPRTSSSTLSIQPTSSGSRRRTLRPTLIASISATAGTLCSMGCRRKSVLPLSAKITAKWA